MKPYKVRLASGGTRWEVVVEGAPTPDGQRTQRRLRGMTRAELLDKAAEVRAEVASGAISDGRNMTLAQYLQDEWLPAVTRTSKRGRPLAPTTAERYAAAVADAVEVAGGVRLRDLRPRHVEQVRDALLARGLAPQTVGDRLRILGQALRRAVAKGLIPRNPVDAVDRPVGRPRALPVITPDLAERILAAATGTEFDAAAHLALGVTLRREEVLGLTWDAVDPEAGMLEVRQAVTFAGGEVHVGEPKSEAGARTIELPGFVVAALKRHHKAQGVRRLAVGEAWDPRGFVVDRGDGGPWAPPSFSKAWSRFAERSGFPGVTFHGLRHGAATLLLAAGVADPVAIRLMGHADTRILRRYQEVVPDLLKDAAARMDALLGNRGAR